MADICGADGGTGVFRLARKTGYSCVVRRLSAPLAGLRWVSVRHGNHLGPCTVKALLVFAVVLVLAWRWRAWRESRQRHTARKDAAAVPKSIGMVPCHRCGVHVPANDTVSGALGNYCSVAHRLNKEP